MSNIEIVSVIDAVEERADTLQRIAWQKFSESVRPIYGAADNGRLLHIGSCFLLKVDERLYVVTAAHIIDENGITSLYIGTSSTIEILGDFRVTPKVNGRREEDHYNFAYQPVPDMLIEEFSRFPAFCAPSSNLRRQKYEGRAYCFRGYPNSKNKKFDHNNNKVTPKTITYHAFGKPVQEHFDYLGIDGSHHTAIYFGKNSKHQEGQKVSSHNPKGYSGCPVIVIGNLHNVEVISGIQTSKPRLSGMFIEYNKKYCAALIVDIEIIVEK